MPHSHADEPPLVPPPGAPEPDSDSDSDSGHTQPSPSPIRGQLSAKQVFEAGLALIGVTFLVLVIKPELFERAELPVRVLLAIGGALIGAVLPGAFKIRLPFAEGAGALGLFAAILYWHPGQFAVGREPPQVAAPETRAELAALPVASADPAEVARRHALMPETDVLERTAAPLPRIDPATDSRPAPQAGPQPAADARRLRRAPIADVHLPDAAVESIQSARWESVLPISWVKPGDWLGRTYHLQIDEGVYLWPLELQDEMNSARVRVNSSPAGRDAGTVFVRDARIQQGKALLFEAQGRSYQLSLLSIRKAGRRPTDAGYFSAEVLRTDPLPIE